jgi:DNA-binding CsgD family transcriptional regulator
MRHTAGAPALGAGLQQLAPGSHHPDLTQFPRHLKVCLRGPKTKQLDTKMLRTILVYGAILAGGSLGLDWLQYRFLVHRYPLEAYLALIALGFMGLGIWVGARLFRHTPAAPFEANVQVQQTLGISERELQVLELLAAGRSNKEIASRLEVSPNTVKTHVAKLYDKLEVGRRTEAILRARELGMIR